MSVISLEEFKHAKAPHTQGTAKCLGCGHEWEAVIPCATVYCECPSCGLDKGVRLSLVLPYDPLLTCDCGNIYFNVLEEGQLLCGLCGAWHYL